VKIKKYIVQEMQEAMQLIREDLGPEAVIISSYPAPKRSLRDFFQPRRLEVTAAVDDDKGVVLENPYFQKPFAPSAPASSLSAAVPQRGRAGGNFLAVLRERELGMGCWEAWRQRLRNAGVEEKIIDLLFSGLPEEVPETGAPDPDGYAALLLKSKIVSLVEPVYEDGGQDYRLKIFTGPPGAGKTFTVAKLVAKKVLFEGKKVAVISVSPGRPWSAGDVQRLLPGIEAGFERVFTPAELAAAVQRQNDKEEIFVDTEGIPPTSAARLLALKNFLEAVEQPKEVFLVLSCLNRNRDLYAAATEFNRAGFSRLCFTRLDETKAYGSLLNAVCFTGKPVAYAASGLAVPDDFWPVDPQKLAGVLLEGARELHEQTFEIVF
jgi:flagellar biosynthesis protein FlhF